MKLKVLILCLSLLLSVFSALGQTKPKKSFWPWKKKSKPPAEKVEPAAEKAAAPQSDPKSVSPSETNAEIKSEPAKPGEPEKKTETAAAQEKPKKNDDAGDFRYRIGLLDQIQVEVYNHGELSRIVSVSEQGTISLPRISKPISVLCRTENQVADDIKAEYKKFLRDPYVNARVTQQNSQPFAVIGAVEKPGSFFLNRRISLLELIAFAGGPDVEKAGTKVQVARIGGISGCDENNINKEINSSEEESKAIDSLFAYYNLKDVFENRNNPFMRPGDIVRVLEFDEIYVTGNVVKPEPIRLKDKFTVTQAIAAAGGLLPSTKRDKVLIKRKEANGNTIEIIVDLDKIAKKLAPDTELLASDVVYVPTDQVKSTLGKIVKSLTGGAGNIFMRVPAP